MPNTSIHCHVLNIFAVADVMFSCHPKADKKSFRLACVVFHLSNTQIPISCI